MILKINKTNHKGFTIVELMIATAVFGVVLLVAGSAMIAIGRIYYKGITSARVQGVSRSIMEDVTRSLQFSANDVSSPPMAGNINIRCFGDDRYTYVIDQPASNAPGVWGLRRDKKPADGCSVTGVDLNSAEQMLGNNMRLLEFYVSKGDDGAFKVKIKVAYGDDDLLTTYDNNGNPVSGIKPVPEANAKDTECKSGIGSSFCAVSGLETLVTSRIE